MNSDALRLRDLFFRYFELEADAEEFDGSVGAEVISRGDLRYLAKKYP